MQVDACQTPLEFLDEWCDLYGQLTARHGITGLPSILTGRICKAARCARAGNVSRVGERGNRRLAPVVCRRPSRLRTPGCNQRTRLRVHGVVRPVLACHAALPFERETGSIWAALQASQNESRWTACDSSRPGGQPAPGKRSSAGASFSQTHTTSSRRNEPRTKRRTSRHTVRASLFLTSTEWRPRASMTIPYRRSAVIYDALFRKKDYRKSSRTLVRILRRVTPGARSLLDVGCGTGRHLEHLRDRFDVEGLDLEPSDAGHRPQTLSGVRFHRGSLVAFSMTRRFDVITCLFGAIAYAKTLASLRKATRCLVRHLQPGGVLVVEPWISPDGLSLVASSSTALTKPISRSHGCTSRNAGDLCQCSIHSTWWQPATALRISQSGRAGSLHRPAVPGRPFTMRGSGSWPQGHNCLATACTSVACLTMSREGTARR